MTRPLDATPALAPSLHCTGMLFGMSTPDIVAHLAAIEVHAIAAEAAHRHHLVAGRAAHAANSLYRAALARSAAIAIRRDWGMG